MNDTLTFFLFCACVVSLLVIQRFIRMHNEYLAKVYELNNTIEKLKAQSLEREKEYNNWLSIVRQHEGNVYIWQSMQTDNFLDTNE